MKNETILKGDKVKILNGQHCGKSGEVKIVDGYLYVVEVDCREIIFGEDQITRLVGSGLNITIK